ncbi:MAG: lipoate protein ligase C-terminal domain-containing protein [Candidatus Bathyarchaeia archaeon]|nr:hypothetical protein [Candidatus Bathyarchaeota archaeon]
MFRSEYKVEGGKLIKVQLNKDDGRIGAIKITGDFFMYPEGLIEDLEKFLIGCPLNETIIIETIRKFIEEKGITLLGVAPEDFARCIIKAGEGVG